MAPALNLAIYVRTEGAHESDSKAIDGFVKFMRKMNVDVKVILDDNPYGTERNRSPAVVIGAGTVASRHGGLKDPSGSGAEEGGTRFTPRTSRPTGREP
jgi:hypothetical protein